MYNFWQNFLNSRDKKGLLTCISCNVEFSPCGGLSTVFVFVKQTKREISYDIKMICTKGKCGWWNLGQLKGHGLQFVTEESLVDFLIWQPIWVWTGHYTVMFAVPCSAIQCSAMQHSAVLYSSELWSAIILYNMKNKGIISYRGAEFHLLPPIFVWREEDVSPLPDISVTSLTRFLVKKLKCRQRGRLWKQS